MTTVKTDAIEAWVEELWDRKGTDLLLTAGAPPLMRLDGQMTPVAGVGALDADHVEKLVHSVLGTTMTKLFKERKDVDFSFNWREHARFRGNAFRQRGAVSLALRMIPFSIPTFEELGLPEVANRFVNLPQGLILVTGPTGSGKSTTLASMIDYINQHRRCHILTIEDPIEYVHSHKRSAVNQREIGEDAEDFYSALRSALREDPDVLLVGEMRDPESIAVTLTIAETGHLVFATLHTNDTAQALDRIIDVFPSDRREQVQVQLSATLQGVIYQRLMPKIGGGLTAAFEVMVGNSAVKNLVREGKTRQLRNVVATHQSEGMQTLESGLNDLVARDVIDYETALSVSLYPKEVDKPAPTLPPESELADASSASNGRRGRRKS